MLRLFATAPMLSLALRHRFWLQVSIRSRNAGYVSPRRVPVFALLAWLVAAGRAFASFDVASASNGGNWSTGVSSVSWSHTVSGVNPFLAVAIYIYNSSALTVSSITYNGVALTKLDAITAGLESNHQDMEVWYLKAPASGTFTITATLSGTSNYVQGQALSYDNINQTAPIDVHAIGQQLTSSTGISQAVTTTAKDDLVGFVWGRVSPTLTAGVGTVLRSTAAPSSAAGDSGIIVDVGSQSLAWNASSSSTWPGIETFGVVDISSQIESSKLVAGGVLQGAASESSKLTGYGVLRGVAIESSKLNGYGVLQGAAIESSKLVAYAVLQSELNRGLVLRAPLTHW